MVFLEYPAGPIQTHTVHNVIYRVHDVAYRVHDVTYRAHNVDTEHMMQHEKGGSMSLPPSKEKFA